MATRDPHEIEAILRSETSGLRDKIVRNLGDFTVALFGISGAPQERLRLAGTGTLVVLDGRRFILTALHVWEEVLKTADKIGITMKEDIVHCTVIGRSAVEPFGPPKPAAWNEWGPDLVLLSVPAADVGRISAYRSFWNVTAQRDINAAVLESLVLMGTPAALGTFTETFADVQINGMFLGPEAQHTQGEFDYLDYEIDLSLAVPRDFGGVSGGGVWQVYIYWVPLTGEIDWRMSLHGVAFFQLPIIAERRTIRCHGPESIRAALRLIQR
jgi:hypothetical protein